MGDTVVPTRRRAPRAVESGAGTHTLGGTRGPRAAVHPPKSHPPSECAGSPSGAPLDATHTSPRKTKTALKRTAGQNRWVSDARRARRKRSGRRRTAEATDTTTTSLACVSEWRQRRVPPRKVKIRQAAHRSLPVKRDAQSIFGKCERSDWPTPAAQKWFGTGLDISPDPAGSAPDVTLPDRLRVAAPAAPPCPCRGLGESCLVEENKKVKT